MTFRYFFGINQSVSGNDYDDPRAPWNQSDIEYSICTECNGDGGVYYNEDGDELSVADYQRLSEEDQAMCIFEKCPHCDGDGVIECDIELYEPEFEYED